MCPSAATSPLRMQVPDGLVTQVQVRQLLHRRVDQGAGAHFADSDGATDVERKWRPRLAFVFPEHHQQCCGALVLISVWDDLLQSNPLVQPVGVGLYGQVVLLQLLEHFPGHGSSPLFLRSHSALQGGRGPTKALSLGVKPLM